MPLDLSSTDELSASARTQQRLWGVDPEGWALFSEPHNRPLFDAVLDAAAVGTGSRLLDVGCGSGLVLLLASDRGAQTSGVDVSPGLLDIAGSRVPAADLRLHDLQILPFADASFDAVTGVNAFQFAERPQEAIAEAARVLVPGGRLAIGMFAEPERAESTAIHLAMAALSPPAREADHAPYALSVPGNLEAAMGGAGLTLAGTGEVECRWHYRTADDAVRGLIGSAGGTRAVEDAGRERVEATIRRALEPFTEVTTGEVLMRNIFRWVSAVKS
ncbi:class I SAM-dependent methyltransferase [soil metagenome]